MEISHTIRTLAQVSQSLDAWIPRRTARPDALIADLNDVYVASTKNRGMDELFACDDVGSPSLTLMVGIEAEFDLPRVVKSMRTRLHMPVPGPADEIGNAGFVWSYGRYDFVYDSGSGSLRISHKYSHRRGDTKSVSSIAKQMIEYAINYLQEVYAVAEENTASGESQGGRDGMPRPRRLRTQEQKNGPGTG